MQSYFCSSTAVLLVDPQAPAEDNLIIIVFLDDNSPEPALRRLKIDGGQEWLHSLEKSVPALPLKSKNHIVGTVVQVRYNPNIR